MVKLLLQLLSEHIFLLFITNNYYCVETFTIFGIINVYIYIWIITERYYNTDTDICALTFVQYELNTNIFVYYYSVHKFSVLYKTPEGSLDKWNAVCQVRKK